MARRKKHEEHQNHEAWAIPYGDLITLLLAFFVVMYSMSSVNEGKYRILSDSLLAAFRGPSKTVTPIQIGSKSPSGKGGGARLTGVAPTALLNVPDPRPAGAVQQRQNPEQGPRTAAGRSGAPGSLESMAGQVRRALQGLIDEGNVRIRETPRWLEVEVNTDILFASGDAKVSTDAVPVVERIAGILEPFPNPIRVEGHTDNVPIRTAVFPSNWELSAARAANVVQLFTASGVDPTRMEIIGLGEYHPVAANDSAEGRNRNRRVMIIVLEATSAEDEYNRQRRGPGTAEEEAVIPMAATANPLAGPAALP